MARRGRKAFESAEDLQKAVDAYFDDCESKDIFADEAGMLVALDISESTYRRMMEDIQMKEIFARARAKRESFLVRRMCSEPKLAQGCLNALKQNKNGGYTDGKENNKASGEVKVTINLKGCEGFNPFE